MIGCGRNSGLRGNTGAIGPGKIPVIFAPGDGPILFSRHGGFGTEMVGGGEDGLVGLVGDEGGIVGLAMSMLGDKGIESAPLGSLGLLVPGGPGPSSSLNGAIVTLFFRAERPRRRLRLNLRKKSTTLDNTDVLPVALRFPLRENSRFLADLDRVPVARLAALPSRASATPPSFLPADAEVSVDSGLLPCVVGVIASLKTLSRPNDMLVESIDLPNISLPIEPCAPRLPSSTTVAGPEPRKVTVASTRTISVSPMIEAMSNAVQPFLAWMPTLAPQSIKNRAIELWP